MGISDLVKNPNGTYIWPLWWISVKSGGCTLPNPLSSWPCWCPWDLFKSLKFCLNAKEKVVCGKQREATAPIQSLVKLQPWFLSLQWKTCLRQNCRLGSCTCSEWPAFGQNIIFKLFYNYFYILYLYGIDQNHFVL